MKRFRVQFLPSMKEVMGEKGKAILECAREGGAYIDSQCNGKGKCGKCRVRILKGKTSPFTQEESTYIQGVEKGMGYRLACMARVVGDVTALVTGENILTASASKKLFSKRSKEIYPAVKSYQINLTGSKSEIPIAITEVLWKQHGTHNIIVGPLVMKSIEKGFMNEWEKITVHVWMDREIISVAPGWDEPCLGIALDIGTTTVAAYLCDLKSGEVIASGSATNPQILYGADIMSRIVYSAAHPGEGVKRMKDELIQSVNALIHYLITDRGYTSQQIMDMTVVGNTVMHHIFLGLAPDSLGMWPFEPLVKGPVNRKAHELGVLMNPDSYIYVLPVEAGFVGADNVGVLISEEPYRKEGISLIIDIGTNGEIVLGNRSQLLSCSCATGPALEGAQISCGMRAAPGAIEKIHIDPETHEVDYKVIGRKGWARERPPKDLKPSGICGSGIIDIVAQLFKAKLIRENGAFSRTTTTPRLRKGRAGVTEFVVAWKDEASTGDDIVFTQKDVRQVQLAKAALHGGCRVLMGYLHLDEIQRITIAGAFGVHVDKKSALILGLFPPCKSKNIIMAGNAAGHGAYLALVNRNKREEADRIARKVTHIELATEKGFQKEFLKALEIQGDFK